MEKSIYSASPLERMFSAIKEESGEEGGSAAASEWKHSVASITLMAISPSFVLRTLC